MNRHLPLALLAGALTSEPAHCQELGELAPLVVEASRERSGKISKPTSSDPTYLLDENYALSKTDYRHIGLPRGAKLGMPRMLGTGVSLNW